MHFASVALVLFSVSFMNCSPTCCKEGCVACGKTKEATRKLVSSTRFTTEELEEVYKKFGDSKIVHSLIKSNVSLAQNRKKDKSEQTFVILVCAEG